MADETSFNKGSRITIHGGAYATKAEEAWHDADLGWGSDEHEMCAPVIIRLKRGRGTIKTVIQKCNFDEANEIPQTWTDRVLTYRPEIKRNLFTVTRQMAQCDGAKANRNDMVKMMSDHFDNALTLQEKRGHKATWRKIPDAVGASRRDG